MSRRIAISSLVGPLLLIASTTMAADEYPHLKPGLWSSTQTMKGENAMTMSGKMCTSDEVFKTYQNLSKDPNRPCKATSMVHTGSTYSSETECNFGGKVSHSSSVMTVTGDTGMHLDMKMNETGGMTIDMKYLGACPADMVPGDYVSSTGMKMNVLPGAKAGAAKP